MPEAPAPLPRDATLPPGETADDPMARLIDVALEMTERDNAIIDRMEDAYRAGDRDEVFRLAGELIDCTGYVSGDDL